MKEGKNINLLDTSMICQYSDVRKKELPKEITIQFHIFLTFKEIVQHSELFKKFAST